jgi:SWI/SNF-related matrix-associated actin-dependent regulator 1 of chromatin subfamily A
MFTLRDYQRAGAAFLRDRNGILQWEPGVGKTFAALEAAASVASKGRTLYVCPASLRWQTADAVKTRDPHAKVQVIENAATKPNTTADVVILSYEGASSAALWPALYQEKWGALILDEAHYLKSRDAKRTHAIYGARHNSRGALFRRAHHAWALTGTPVLSSPADLYTHYSRLFPFAVVDPETGDPLRYAQWEDEFCLKRHTAFGEQIIGGKNLDKLAEILRPFVHRLTRADVLAGLPPLTVDMVRLTGEALSLKDLDPETVAAVLALYEGEDMGGHDNTLRPAVSTLRARIAEAKADAVISLVREELAGGRDQVIVFGIHTAALRRIHGALEQEADAVLIDGSNTPRGRAQAISRFQAGTARVLVGQLHAAGTGLNLQNCSRVIFAEGDWTPAINEQGIARAYRSGQRNPVHVSFVSLKGSIDERVAGACARKARVIAKINGE